MLYVQYTEQAYHGRKRPPFPGRGLDFVKINFQLISQSIQGDGSVYATNAQTIGSP